MRTDQQRQRLIALGVLIFAGFLTLYPVAWIVAASYKTNQEIFASSLLEPGHAGIANYVSSFERRPFAQYLLNSIIASSLSVIITVAISCLAGYSFAKFRYRLKRLFWLFVLAGIMIPLEAIVIPLFLQVHAFGWTNSYAGLILPTAFNVVGVFIVRQAMLAIPDDYIEAARIDGASEPRILIAIALPMILPSVAVVAVLTFNLTWNSYLWPLIVVSDDSLRTLPLGMAAFQKSFNTQYGEVMAVSVFGTIPTVLFFIAFQRYFIESALAEGLK